MPNGLSSIEEGRLLYDLQVDQHQPKEEISKEDEDQEDEQEVPYQEEHPQTRFATYQDFKGLGGTV